MRTAVSAFCKCKVVRAADEYVDEGMKKADIDLTASYFFVTLQLFILWYSIIFG